MKFGWTWEVRQGRQTLHIEQLPDLDLVDLIWSHTRRTLTEALSGTPDPKTIHIKS